MALSAVAKSVIFFLLVYQLGVDGNPKNRGKKRALIVEDEEPGATPTEAPVKRSKGACAVHSRSAALVPMLAPQLVQRRETVLYARRRSHYAFLASTPPSRLSG